MIRDPDHRISCHKCGKRFYGWDTFYIDDNFYCTRCDETLDTVYSHFDRETHLRDNVVAIFVSDDDGNKHFLDYTAEMYDVYHSFYFVDFNYHQFKEAYFDGEHNILVIPHSMINRYFAGYYMNYSYSDEQCDLFITKVLNDEYDKGKGEDWLR